jgi:hypothetical protein
MVNTQIQGFEIDSHKTYYKDYLFMGYNLTLKILTNPETLRSFIDLKIPSFLKIIHFHERFLFIVLFNLVYCG